ncbi:MAG: hypothetical protein KDK33_18380, partial [Leptospiraceae bacterium]|nr:hypothetical protein [Leptospiraceae bacterium]
TSWLLIAVLFAMVYRKEPWRMHVVTAGLLLSTGYLIWGQFAKNTVDRAFLADLKARGIEPEQFMSNPTALNTVLWMGMARQGDTLYVALHGLADPDGPLQWLEIPRNSHYIQSAISKGNPYIERLLWFCRGYYYLTEDASGNLWLHDLRFGRSDGFLTDRGNFIFRFELLRNGERIVGFKQVPPVMRGRLETFHLLWRRIQGDTSIRGGFRMGFHLDDSNREL